MAGKDFLEEQRRRQRELVAARAARQNPEAAPVVVREEKTMSASEKVSNFWFYNKYFVLGALLLAVMLFIGIKQCADREKFDTEVVLYTYTTYTSDQIDAIEEELEKYGVDIHGDGVVNYQIIDCSYDKKNTGFDHKNAKGSKLTANITSNKKAILFITDAETFKQLTDRYAENDIEFFVDCKLPADGGKSLPLSEDFYKNVNAKSTAGIKLPEGLKISQRITGKNLTIGEAEKQTAAARELFSKMQAGIKNEAK